jgi:hypothetical protein
MLSDRFPRVRLATTFRRVYRQNKTMDTATRVEHLLRRISALVAERQELRGDQERSPDLERNRVEIARCQRELNHALIQLYGKKAA